MTITVDYFLPSFEKSQIYFVLQESWKTGRLFVEILPDISPRYSQKTVRESNPTDDEETPGIRCRIPKVMLG